MNRRDFLRRAGILAAGIVAADQLELLDRLTWEPRRLWTGCSLATYHDRELTALFKRAYSDPVLSIPATTPLLKYLRGVPTIKAPRGLYFDVALR